MTHPFPEGAIPDDNHHRDVGGGAARAAVFGVSDGLVSNVGLILGVAGAAPSSSVVRLAGLAGLLAGGISMAAGEYNSMKVQAELFEREIALERQELARNPEIEMAELAARYESRGIDADLARRIAQQIMADPEIALEVHVREELGIDPDGLGSPLAAAGSSLVAFGVGAVIPLMPWFFLDGNAAIITSLLLAVLAAVMVGEAIFRFTETHRWMSVGRQVAFTVIPAALTFAIGSLVGVTV
ncbi:MAG: hypothetical protein GY929_18635 [Actinomycetia bacterium]|nr:hypothetical protein [Actinomycetes bacterium]